jgi:hypothetical protein
LPAPLVIETDSTLSLFTREPVASTNLEELSAFVMGRVQNVTGPHSGLIKTHESLSPYGYHVTFAQTFNGLPVFGTEIKLNLDLTLHVRSLLAHSCDVTTWGVNRLQAEIGQFDSAQALATVGQKILRARMGIWPDPLQPALEVITYDSTGPSSKLIVLNQSGDQLMEANMVRRLSTPDSVVTAAVFRPDPLTTAHQSYAIPYTDLSDADNTFLNAERVNVQMKVAYSAGNFTLENTWVKAVDISPPVIAPPIAVTPDFSFTRAQDGFEDVNAYYHITSFREHLSQLGFDLLGAEQVVVDAHALNGADQSLLVTSTNPRQLLLGEGGVDDGEDADVVIHEYGHHLSYSASPNTNLGFERQAFEEGHCDYLAASYSRAIDPYDWHKVFSWDGHNEFWTGRVVNSNKVYPNDLGSNVHSAGEIWSAAMMQIWDALGRDYTDQLALQATYAWSSNMSMPDAALTILQADDVISGGANYDVIYQIMVARGLLGDLEDDVTNTQALLGREGSLLVTLSAATAQADIAVFDLSGKLIYSEVGVKNKLSELPNSLFGSSGVYIVRLTSGDQRVVKKVVLVER